MTLPKTKQDLQDQLDAYTIKITELNFQKQKLHDQLQAIEHKAIWETLAAGSVYINDGTIVLFTGMVNHQAKLGVFYLKNGYQRVYSLEWFKEATWIGHLEYWETLIREMQGR